MVEVFRADCGGVADAVDLLGGILGGILAIPLAAALRVILFRYVWKVREG